MILAEQEHLRRGYKALLEIKGHSVTDDNPDCAVVDIGDDFTETSLKTVKAVAPGLIVFIVSATYSGKIPQIAEKTVVLRCPVTAEELLKALIL
jgi:ABC-type Fe2+-enterobactin transport system substrate-binding protein